MDLDKNHLKSLDESIAAAMDSHDDVAIVPFLPYILQDFWEIGTPPETVIKFIETWHVNDLTGSNSINVLDLGCGKGAVSVKLAATLNCNCYGIDGIPEFIETSKEKAKEYNVESLCRFEVGDIRDVDTQCFASLQGIYDVIILGAVGQVFGDYFSTLTTLSKLLNPDGIIIINDAYTNDSIECKHPLVFHRCELLRQTKLSGMELIDECADADLTGSKTCQGQNNAKEFENLKKRCHELITMYPQKTSLFEKYVQIQADEYEALENKMICSMMVFRRFKIS